jgi:tetratricopeptide (TPR) repeat protein
MEQFSERLGPCHSVIQKARDVRARSLLRLNRVAEAADLALPSVECDRQAMPIVFVSELSDAIPLLDRGGRWADGERVARELTQRLLDMGGGHGAMVLDSQVATARFVSLQGRREEADAMFQALIAREAEARDDRNVLARLHLAYGAHLAAQGRLEEAEQRLQAAVNTMGDVRRGTRYDMLDDIIIEFIALYQAWGKPDKVAEYQSLQREALATRRVASGSP